jgi:hypothetical protein
LGEEFVIPNIELFFLGDAFLGDAFLGDAFLGDAGVAPNKLKDGSDVCAGDINSDKVVLFFLGDPKNPVFALDALLLTLFAALFTLFTMLILFALDELDELAALGVPLFDVDLFGEKFAMSFLLKLLFISIR